MDDRFSTLNGDLMTEALMLEEFNRLVNEPPAIKTTSPPQTAQESPTCKEGILEEIITTFQKKKKEKLEAYVEQGLYKTQKGNTLTFLDGWDKEKSDLLGSKTTGGFFLTCEGLGIAVNPGKHFLKRFHEQGKHLAELDLVIVTKDHPDDYQDLFAIYQLNHQCNLTSPEFHLIRYLLHPSLFRKAASQLKPHFKQERNACISLDLFDDTDSRETMELSENVRLNYYAAYPFKDKSLALVFELSDKTSLKTVKLGYFSSAPYSEEALSLLKGCEILILGFEETNKSDLSKREPLKEALGFFGIHNLCNELGPKVAFVTEQTSSIGDIRIELVKKLKRELALENCSSLILPADTGLTLDLTQTKIKGTFDQQWIDLKNTKVIQPNGPFSPLHFLSIDNIL